VVTQGRVVVVVTLVVVEVDVLVVVVEVVMLVVLVDGLVVVVELVMLVVLVEVLVEVLVVVELVILVVVPGGSSALHPASPTPVLHTSLAPVPPAISL
jgi:hypothetical protein